MAKKVILKDDNVEIMPITRGELVLDSSGQLAFHSSQFLATQSLPGLMSGEDKTKLDSLEKVTVEDKKVEQVNTTTNSSYRILFSNSADDTTKTEGARKSAKLLFNPSTGALTATALIGKLNWSNLNNVPENFTPAQHIHNTSEITALTSYSKASSASDLVTTDTLNVALGKLEYKADTAYTFYKSITGTDNDEIINKWEEIVDFIDSVKEGTDITDEFVTRKTNQTITGTKTFNNGDQCPITLVRSSSDFISIRFDGSSGVLGYLGFMGVDQPMYRRVSDNAYLDLLHSGNSYINNGVITINGVSITPLTSHQSLANYVTLNGNQTISGVKTFSTLLKFTVALGTAPFTVTSTTKVDNLNADLLDGYHATNFMQYIKGSTYVQANLLNSELWSLAGGNGYIEYYDSGTWFNSRWGKVTAHYGFEGSLSGNASSATKLQTARTIWGQSFDGTGNVSGNLEMGISKVYWNDDASNYFITVNGAGKMYQTSYYGIFFRTGGSDRLAIDSAGNVGIGTTSPSYKLHVNGQVYSTGYVRSGSSDSYVLLGGGGHKALSDFAMASAYVKKAGDTMTGRLTMTGEGIIVTTATTSNYRAGVEFYKGTVADTTYSYDAQIGWHNTGGDGTGSICILPYATSTLPWGGSVGLYITKTELKYNNQAILHSGNSSVSGGGSTWGSSITVKINGTSKTLTIPANPNTWRGITDSYSGTDSTISLSQKGGNALYNALVNGYVSSAGSATRISSLGNKNVADLSSTYGSGLTIAGIYNNGWPFTYGTVINANGNGGVFQIAGEWTGNITSSSNNNYKTEMYLRHRRDSYDIWSTWTRVITDRNYTSYCAPASHSHAYYPLSGNTNMSGDNVWIGSTMGGGTDYWRIGGSGTSDNGVCQITIGDNSNDYFQIVIADYTGTNYTALLVKNGGTYAPHFYENSDQRLKTNIQTILNKDNVPQIKEFDWKESGEHSYGLIAQELEEQGYSELVSTKDDGYKTVNYSAALSLIVGKLQVKIKELEKEIEILKNKN